MVQLLDARSAKVCAEKTEPCDNPQHTHDGIAPPELRYNKSAISPVTTTTPPPENQVGRRPSRSTRAWPGGWRPGAWAATYPLLPLSAVGDNGAMEAEPNANAAGISSACGRCS